MAKSLLARGVQVYTKINAKRGTQVSTSKEKIGFNTSFKRWKLELKQGVRAVPYYKQMTLQPFFNNFFQQLKRIFDKALNLVQF